MKILNPSEQKVVDQMVQNRPQTPHVRTPASEPDMNLAAAQAKVKTLGAPRVTEEFMKSEISTIEFHRMDHTTICLLELCNGFRVIGHSTPASPENFNAEIGQRYAYENAFKQLWAFFGWRLRDALSGGVEGIRPAKLQPGELSPLPQKSWGQEK